jgi:hypothetical protein
MGLWAGRLRNTSGNLDGLRSAIVKIGYVTWGLWNMDTRGRRQCKSWWAQGNR